MRLSPLLLIGLFGRSLAGAEKIPVIYSTDLYHPHVDADDHFDLAALLAMEELDVKAVVLDNAGPSQEERPGRIPLRQICSMTGREIPFTIGLRKPLKSPEDPALDQEARYQGAVDLILKVLEESKAAVAIVAVGSMRDVAAALNRKPALFQEKAGKLLIFIGDAAEEFSSREYNVGLDVNAYVRLMRGGLDVWWVPCFDGGAPKNLGHGSEWVASREALLKDCAPAVQKYFIYCLKRLEGDPIAFLNSPVDSDEKRWLLSDSKELFCTAIFGCLSGRKTCFDGMRYVSRLPGEDAGLEARKVFGFSAVDVTISSDGKVKYGPSPDSKKVKRFEILDRKSYGEAMTSMTADLLERLGRERAPARK